MRRIITLHEKLGYTYLTHNVHVCMYNLIIEIYIKVITLR